MSWLYYLCKPLVQLFFALFTRWKVYGEENIPRKGPVLVVSNHMTFAEPPVLSILLRRPSRFATKEGFFRFRPLGWVLGSWGAFPVHPGRADRSDIRLMEGYLNQGMAVALFPEGTRSREGGLLPALSGAALIARRTGAPILPVGITGTKEMKRLGWLLKRPVITVRFGKPFNVQAGEGKQERAAATRLVMQRIRDLLPPEYHGAYSEEGEDERED